MHLAAMIISLLGLGSDITGAIVLARALLISEDQAVELGVPRVGWSTPEENRQLPQVRDRINQLHDARRGVPLLVLGFIGQAIGVLLSYFAH